MLLPVRAVVAATASRLDWGPKLDRKAEGGTLGVVVGNTSDLASGIC